MKHHSISARLHLKYTFQELLHPLIVGTLPINLATVLAASKLVVSLFHLTWNKADEGVV